MVINSKASEYKYVILLAEKILKPLMKKYLSNDGFGTEEVPNKPADEKSPKNPFQCSQCITVFKPISGVKSHA